MTVCFLFFFSQVVVVFWGKGLMLHQVFRACSVACSYNMNGIYAAKIGNTITHMGQFEISMAT